MLKIGTRTRKTIAFALVMLTTTALAGCGGSDADGEIVVGTWGGDYEDFQQEYVLPHYKGGKSGGVTYAVADADTRMAQMRTEKRGPGSFDVAGLSYLEMQEMVNDGLVEKLDKSKVPNLAHVPDSLKSDYWVPHIYSALVIVYNSDKVKTPPSSWKDLWDPRYKGRIAAESDTEQNWIFAAAAAESGGDPEQSWDRGWRLLQRLPDQARFHASSEEVGQALASEEAWITIDYKARAYQWAKDSDVPLKAVVPDEGTIPQIFASGIPKNAPNPAKAYKYLNAQLDPESQQGFAKNMGYLPTVNNARLDPKTRRALGFTEDERARIIDVDEDYLVEKSAGWRKRWQQKVLNQ